MITKTVTECLFLDCRFSVAAHRLRWCEGGGEVSGDEGGGVGRRREVDGGGTDYSNKHRGATDCEDRLPFQVTITG